MIDGGLRGIFAKNLPDAQWTHVENALMTRGVPDTEYAFRVGCCGWIETKKTHVNSVPHVRPEQVAWLERRRRLGGRAFVAVRWTALEGPRRAARDDLWLILGEGARYLKASGIEGVPRPLVLGCWPNGPGRWDWAEVRGFLVGTYPALGKAP